MGVERIDYYSDEEYRQALQQEEEEYRRWLDEKRERERDAESLMRYKIPRHWTVNPYSTKRRVKKL